LETVSQPSVDTSQDAWGKYLTLVLQLAVKHSITHVRIRPDDTAAIVQFWTDAEWSDEDALTERSVPMHMHLMQKLAALMSGSVPASGQQLHGAFILKQSDTPPMYIHAVIDHDLELVATLERVDESEFGTRPLRQPAP
jgi:hypothetical protein